MPQVKWYQSLGFKGSVGLLLVALGLAIAMIVVVNTKGTELVLEESNRLIEQTGNNAVANLEGRSYEIAGLVKTLGIITQQLPKQEALFQTTLPAIMDFGGDLAIAGGGYWPEPNAFKPGVMRHSFFWGRDNEGELKYYNDYNGTGLLYQENRFESQPDYQNQFLQSPGYHNEEWYVVARHLAPGKCSWSKSYMDPYSYQPMVTCTVAIYDQEQFAGVVTIDLKLEGLHEFTQRWSQQTGGYTFILDRNNKFITYPQPQQVKLIKADDKGNQAEEFMTAHGFAQKKPLFQAISDAVDKMNQSILAQASQMPNYRENLASVIDRDSYQINREEAEFLSAVIADPLNEGMGTTRLFTYFNIPDDVILHEPATVFIFHVPQSYWKYVVVKPLSEARTVATTIRDLLISYIGAIILVAIGIVFIVLRLFLLKPLAETTQAIQTLETLISQDQFDQLKQYEIQHIRSGEIGLLASVFNSMSAKLLSVNRRLQESARVIEEQNRTLEFKVEDRTRELQEKNIAMAQTLQQLKETQEQLIVQEKLASLGGLVAGIAHEINTPIGIGVTAASHLQTKTKDFQQLFANDDLAQEDLEDYMAQSTEASSIILANLNRASELIKSFKQVAVDQASEERRQFNVREYLEEILLSLRPQFKKTKCQVSIHCAADLVLDSYPGAFSQIVTNLVMNSLQHAFEPDDRGIITIGVKLNGKIVEMDYEDDGRGIPPEQVKLIFDPFFTTKRGQGGTGLGLHILFNLIMQKFGGTINCNSVLGKGTRFMVTLPVL